MLLIRLPKPAHHQRDLQACIAEENWMQAKLFWNFFELSGLSKTNVTEEQIRVYQNLSEHFSKKVHIVQGICCKISIGEKCIDFTALNNIEFSNNVNNF